jgi:23S rRNA (guanine745-N1)-methyltransferase
MAKQGYVNMLLHPVKMDYDKEMLESRNIICKSGFFDPMINSVSDLILKLKLLNNKQTNILDAGCGEGSHLNGIVENLRKATNFNILGAGMDISKEGIRIAARDYGDILWCVGDLAQIPFRNKGFDIVLSILSPSNYSEFRRVLSKDGVLIKVVPGSSYLKELRSVFYEGDEKETYSNERVVKYFSGNFNIIHEQNVTYSFELKEEELIHLIRMTPLSWSAGEEKIKAALNMGIKNVIGDFHIIVGKKISKTEEQ